MDSNMLLDDAQRDEQDHASDQHFSRHSPSVQPVTSETDIRQAADSVLPHIPLPDESPSSDNGPQSYMPGAHSPSQLDNLTAEDIHDNF